MTDAAPVPGARGFYREIPDHDTLLLERVGCLRLARKVHFVIGGAGAAKQVAQTAGHQISGQMMPCLIPVADAQLRVVKTMQEYVMLIGISLKCWSQIQHGKSCASPELLDAGIGIEEVARTDARLIDCAPRSIGKNLRSDGSGNNEKPGAMLRDFVVDRRY